MKLAHLIYSALNNPAFRVALESGTLQTSEQQQFELEAAAEVMRYSRHVTGLNGGNHFGGHNRGRGLLNSPSGWGWKDE